MTIRWKDKDPVDVILVEFDFSADATTVTTPAVTIAVADGVDADPSLMLVGAPTVTGAKVYQRIQGGLNGVVYSLQCQVDNGDDHYSIEAILPVRTRPVYSSASPIYVTEAMFEQRFGAEELADLLAGGSSYAEAENEAASLVNGYVATKYSLPLVSAPTMVLAWAADITRYRLWDDHAPEEVRRRYEDAMAQLKLLANGVIALPPGSDGEPQATGISFGGYSNDRVFTADSLANY